MAYTCAFTIQGVQFQAGSHILQLQGADTILGVNWFKEHNPVTFDFLARTITLKDKGNTHTFADHMLPATNILISTKECSKLMAQNAVGYVLYHLPETEN